MPQLEVTGRARLMLKILISIAMIATLLGGCSTYRLDVQQGNAIDDSKVSQLRQGMTPQQVQFLLGSPQVRGTFLREDRWDYVFFHAPSRGPTVQRRVSVFFEGGSVARIEDSQPPVAAAD